MYFIALSFIIYVDKTLVFYQNQGKFLTLYYILLYDH